MLDDLRAAQSRIAIAEVAAMLGLTTNAARRRLAEAVELHYRLPATWARVRSMEVPAWRARRIADTTMALDEESAEFVDQHVAPLADRIGPSSWTS